MLAMVVLALLGFQSLMALVAPMFLILFTLATGAMPISFTGGEMVTTPLGAMDVTAMRLLGFLLAASIVIAIKSEAALRYMVAYKYHTLFLLFCVLSTVYAPSMAYSVRMISKLAGPYLFFLLVMCVVTTQKELQTMSKAIIASSVLLILIALVTKALGVNADPRLTSPGMGPATFSAHIVTAGMLVLASFITSRRAGYAVILAIIAAATLAAFTRISIAAMFLGGAAILFLGTRGTARYVLPMVGALALPALFLFSDKFRERMFKGGDKLSGDQLLNNPELALEHLHGSGRFDAWSAIMGRLFEPSPLVGSGAGATQHYFYTHSVTGLGAIHSEYIRLLAEVGIVGLVIFITAMLVYLFRALSNIRNDGTIQEKSYSLAAVGAVITYLIFLATDNGFDYVSQFGLYVFALIAMGEKAKELRLSSVGEVRALREIIARAGDLPKFADIDLERR